MFPCEIAISRKKNHKRSDSCGTVATIMVDHMLDASLNHSLPVMSGPPFCDNFSVLLPDPSTSDWLFQEAQRIKDIHKPWHPYVNTIFCNACCIVNLANIVVLTRKDMHTAVNTFLTAIALCDFVVMLSTSIFAAHFTIVLPSRCDASDMSKGWAYFMLFYTTGSVVFHSTSVWLSVKLAHMRYNTLKGVAQAQAVQAGGTSIKQALWHIILVFSFVLICCVPMFLVYQVGSLPFDPYNDYDPLICGNNSYVVNENVSIYVVMHTPLALEFGCITLRISYWVLGLLFKMVPCVLLTVYVMLLVCVLKRIQRARDQRFPSEQHQRVDGTTRMLIIILTICLLCELPQGALAIAVAVFEEAFRKNFYNQLGEFIDFLSLFQSSVNFLIYCVMSRQFRVTFCKLFMPYCAKRLYQESTFYEPMTMRLIADATTENGERRKLSRSRSPNQAQSMI